MKSTYHSIRRHIITGFIFIMPILITLAVVGKFWGNLMKIGAKVSKLIRIDTMLGNSGDAVMAILVFLFFCILAGFLVRLPAFKRISDWLDEKLSSFIPGYTDIKKQTVTKVGMGPQEEVFRTCLVKIQDYWQPAYIVDEKEDGSITAFVPQAPTFTAGNVIVVDAGQFKMLKVDSKTLNGYLKRLGKGLTIE